MPLAQSASCTAHLTDERQVNSELSAVYSRAKRQRRINLRGVSGEVWSVGLTCDSVSVARRLAPRNEDDIALARVGVVVLEEEKVVDAVIAQGRGLDHDTKWTS